MSQLKNINAVITGAASGIGQATAILLAEHGANVAISDVNEAGLNETADHCRAKGVKVYASKLDVADRAAWESYAEDVKKNLGSADMIINNAGVTVTSRIDEMKYEDFEWVMNINFWGMVYGTQAFLPQIKASESGYIANVSSIFGLIAVPTQAAYHASKFGIRGYTECLMQEMAESNPRVTVSCIMPGGIKTNIVRNARKFDTSRDLSEEQLEREFDKIARTTPRQAAETIVNGMLKRKKHILIGSDAHAVHSMQRLFPTGYQGLLKAGESFLKKRREKRQAKKA